MSFAKKEMRRECEKKARDVLNMGENRIKLACAVLLCASITVLLWLVSSLSSNVLDTIGGMPEYAYYPAAQIMLYVLVIFLAAPLYVGCFRMSLLMTYGEQVEIIDVFYTFSSAGSYFRALRLSLGVFLRILPIIIALRIHAIMNYLSFWLVFFDETIKAVNIFFVPVAILLVMLACFSFGSVSFAYICEDMKLCKARKYARKARRKNYGSVIAVAYTTLFKLVLSILTLGILSVVHTIPLAMLTYCHTALKLKNIYDNNHERIDI